MRWARVVTSLCAALVLLVGIAVTAPVDAGTVDEALRRSLENSYQRFLDAAASGDRGRLRDAISRQSFSDAAITLAAIGQPFDADVVRSFGTENPDLAAARLIETRGSEREAALLYIRDLPVPPGTPPEVAFTFIRFTREANDWRYDALLDFKDRKVQEDGSETVFDDAWLPPGFGIR